MIKNKKILIFGGAGSLGTKLVENLLDNNEIYVSSRDEAKHWDLRNKFQNNKKLKTLVCDVRDKQRVKEVLLTTRPAIIIIAQALKQVDTCEFFPEESIETNINGTRNVLDSIKEFALSGVYEPEEVCFVSTDKAANPINVYGMCKSISEKLTFNLAKLFTENNIKTKIIVTRYGNVLSSKGSIIPLFLKQANDPKCTHFTITDPNMTRFMMTLQESVELIFYAIENGKTSQLWVPKLPSMKIIDLAEIFSETYSKDIKNIGIRPGEKLHEIMLTEEENLISKMVNSKYFVVEKISQITQHINIGATEYSSKDTIDKDSLRNKIFNFIETDKDFKKEML